MITQEMKVYVVYGFWKYENGAIILKVFDTEDKAKEYIDNFDFKAFSDMMKGFGFSGDYILELYENGYENDSQLTTALTELKKLL